MPKQYRHRVRFYGKDKRTIAMLRRNLTLARIRKYLTMGYTHWRFSQETVPIRQERV